MSLDIRTIGKLSMLMSNVEIETRVCLMGQIPAFFLSLTAGLWMCDLWFWN